jgi:hypothetical protein
MAYAACHTHPAYSPDLAFSDFYMFLTIKEKLERIQVADEDQFLESLQEISRSIDQEELNDVFQACVQRIQKARQGKTRQDKARQGKTRQDKARQGKTRQRRPHLMINNFHRY